MTSTINVDPTTSTAADHLHTIDPRTGAPITTPVVANPVVKLANSGTMNVDPSLATAANTSHAIDPVTRAPITTVVAR